MNKNYSLGQIYRLGLLKNHEGKPYRHKATISRIVRYLPGVTKRDGPFGQEYAIPKAEIARYNQKW